MSRNTLASAIKVATTRRIASLFGSFGSNEYIGEAVTIAMHGLQTAYAAKKAGESQEVQIAALLHDIGHLLSLEAGQNMQMKDKDGHGTGALDHDIIGGDFLTKLGFSKNVTFVAERHVDAKRYLCARMPGYYEALSPASKTTLLYQNGPMSEAECLDFESSESWAFAAQVRKYDDAAKEFGLDVPGLETYLPLIENHIEENISNMQRENGSDGLHDLVSPYAHSYVLSSPQLQQWDIFGMLHITNAFADEDETRTQLQTWANEVAEFAPLNDTFNARGKKNISKTNGELFRHYEAINGNNSDVKLARIENFSHCHSGWGNLTFGLVNDLISQVYREKAVLFKDKINFKLAGGAGFLCHQDVTAYAADDLAKHHVSAMVAIDEATIDNGCLEVAPGMHKDGILKHKAGVICNSVVSNLTFVEVITKPGDIVLFDSFLPHRSGPNNTQNARRLAYLTYNKEREGDFHTKYYALKKASMGKSQMSLNKDFAGRLI